MATYQLAAGRGRRLRQTWPRGVVGVGQISILIPGEPIEKIFVESDRFSEKYRSMAPVRPACPYFLSFFLSLSLSFFLAFLLFFSPPEILPPLFLHPTTSTRRERERGVVNQFSDGQEKDGGEKQNNQIGKYYSNEGRRRRRRNGQRKKERERERERERQKGKFFGMTISKVRNQRLKY